MNALNFTKMSGCGNDFVVVDNRQATVALPEMPELVRAVCRRRLSVGADGVIFIDRSATPGVAFRWHFFNADGSRAEMCGNGARCAARYAVLNGIAEPALRFETDAGLIHARVTGDQVRIEMTDPVDFEPHLEVQAGHDRYAASFLNTGVPHLVIECGPLGQGLDEIDLGSLAPPLRYHERFAPAGTNVNFIEIEGAQRIRLRTYERGVEDETLACGTGAVAAALVTAHARAWASPIRVAVRSGGTLSVGFESARDGFRGVTLGGDARFIYGARLDPEALS